MNTKTKLAAGLIISYSVILSTLAIANGPAKHNSTKLTSFAAEVSSPKWVEIEAEPQADQQTPMRRAQKAGPKPGEESPRKFPCLRTNPKTGKPMWKLCMKSEGYPSTDSQRVVTELEQGGRPGAMTVVRVN